MPLLFAVLRAIAAISAVFLLGALTLGVWAGGLWLLEQAAEKSVSPATSVAGRVVLTWTMIIVLVGISVRVFVAGFRALYDARALFGETAEAQVVSLGVTMFLFRDSLYQVLVTPVWVLSSLLTRVPQSVLRSAENSREGVVGMDQMVAGLAIALQSVAAGLGDLLRDLLQWWRVADITMAFATAVVIGQILSAAQGTDSPERISRLRIFLRTLSPAQRHRVVLGGVLLISAYLSIAAIVAIPWLQQRSPAEPANKEQLRAALDSIILSPADFDKQFPQDLKLTMSAFVPLDQALKEAGEDLERTKKGATDRDPAVGSGYVRARIENARYFQGMLRSQVEVRARAWENLRDAARQEEADSVKTAVSAFEAETSAPMSSQERAAYRQALEQWFRGRRADWHGSLRRCSELSRSWVSTVQDWAERQAAEFRADVEEARRIQASGRFQPPTGFTETRPLVPVLQFPRSLGDECARPAADVTRPTLPDPGLGLGPFGMVSSWLLRTRSLALALITGMLGFGLLGAAISSFVQGDPARPQQATTLAPTISDLGVVVIRGMSAAVIVFLGVKGGLAAYAVGETEPNAYVLFFTCLVGAAFSERVWAWARVKLEGQLKTTESEGAAPSDPQDRRTGKTEAKQAPESDTRPREGDS